MDSKYFSEDEQVCRCCGKGAELINPLLLEQLDKLREIWGGPVFCECMYRCPKHNYEIGGVRNSQHTVTEDRPCCNAADIWVDGDYWTFYYTVINSELFDSVGCYPPGEGEFVHVDVRADATLPNYYLW